jgi:glycosyltransferase involved in cell wall biosynthesis
VCVFQSRLGNPIAADLQERGIPVDMVPVDSFHSLHQAVDFFRYVKKVNPDVIHTQLETSDVLGGCVSRLLGIPVVSTVHTLTVPSRKRTSRLRKLMRNFCLQYFFNKVIVVSEATRNHYLRLGIKPGALMTLYNGIDLSRFTVGKNQAKSEIFPNVTGGDFVLTTVAVLREPKGIQYMLKALPQMLTTHPNLRYVIVGDGEYRKSLEDLTQSLGLSERVIFLGYRKDIPSLLAASDIFVFPTLDDAFPTVLLEALAIGLPIVASAVGGVPEIICHEENGLLISPSRADLLAASCSRLLSDRELAVRLGQAGRADANKRFNIEQQSQSLVDLYLQLISKN